MKVWCSCACSRLKSFFAAEIVLEKFQKFEDFRGERRDDRSNSEMGNGKSIIYFHGNFLVTRREFSLRTIFHSRTLNFFSRENFLDAGNISAKLTKTFTTFNIFCSSKFVSKIDSLICRWRNFFSDSWGLWKIKFIFACVIFSAVDVGKFVEGKRRV